MKTLDKTGTLSLQELAQFTLQQPYAGVEQNFERAWLGLVSPSFATSMQNIYVGGERRHLRLYGMLGDSQRNAIQTGKSISIGSLSPAARSLLTEIIFTQSTGFAVSDPQKPGAYADYWPGLQREVTEMLSEGIPPNGFISSQVTRTDAIYGIDSKGQKTSLTSELICPPELAMEHSGVQNRYKAFLIGRNATYRLNFQLTPTISFQTTLVDEQLDPGVKAVAFNQLPDWFKKQDKAMQDMMNRLYKGFTTGGGGPPLP
jgi:hypothetical protein